MKVLAVGAHPDDIELGCGGTLLLHLQRGDEITMCVMTPGDRGPQHIQSRVREQQTASKLLKANLIWGESEDGGVTNGLETVRVIENAISQCSPDVIYSHASEDTHQDHCATAAATLAAARRHVRILAYSSPTTKASFAPYVYVDIAGLVDAKIALLRAHESQVLKNGLVDLEAVKAEARFRGFQARVHEAEAFESHRFLWDLFNEGRSDFETLMVEIDESANKNNEKEKAK